jgi:two-component system nitrogen regulation response regulator GlnG
MASACSPRARRGSRYGWLLPLGQLLARFETAMSGTPGARHKILLADGDFRSSQRLATLLGEDGYDVEVVRDAAAAIVRLGRSPLPDVLITELKMPLGDGAGLARYARSQASDIRVIVLTRHPNLFVPAAFGGQTPVVLTKPLDYPRLLEMLTVPTPPSENGLDAASPRF